MAKVVKIIQGPSITEMGVIARVVELDDGSGQVQSYGTRRGWHVSGTTLWSVLHAEQVTREKLEKRGLTPTQIEEVIFDPERRSE